MALNKIFASTEAMHRARLVSGITFPASQTTIQPGVPVIFGTRPAVSLTADGAATRTKSNPVPGITSVTYKNGGASLADGQASFAYDGTFEFAVTGAVTGTANDVEVFMTKATGALTLTADGNNTIHYGWTDYPVSFRKTAGRAPVRIGA